MRRSAGLPVLYVVALASQVGEIGEVPGALIGDPPGQPAGDRGEAAVGAADGPGHSGGGVLYLREKAAAQTGPSSQLLLGQALLSPEYPNPG